VAPKPRAVLCRSRLLECAKVAFWLRANRGTRRPSQLVYTELYDLDGAAQFVADFMSYEPLENALVRLAAVLQYGSTRQRTAAAFFEIRTL
jgi:hypothetical protein